MKNPSRRRSNESNLPVKEPFEVCKDNYRQAIFNIFSAEERSGRPLEYASIQRKIFLADWAQGMSGELLGRMASEIFDEYAASRHAHPTAWSNDTPLWEWTTKQIESPNYTFRGTVTLLQNDTHRKMSREAAQDYLDFVLAEMRISTHWKFRNGRYLRVNHETSPNRNNNHAQRSSNAARPAYRITRNAPQQPFFRRQYTDRWSQTRQPKPMRFRVLKEERKRPSRLWRLLHW